MIAPSLMAGALIGTGGCHSRGGGMLGWPEIGYMLRREAWGMGYGTEFLAGFLEAWWALPRGEAILAGVQQRVDFLGARLPAALRAADGNGDLYRWLRWNTDGSTLLAQMARPARLAGRKHPIYRHPDRAYLRFYDAAFNPQRRL